MIALANGASANERAPAAVQPNVISCKFIKTADQLQAMQNDLAATYCLANDIDLASIRNFRPIGVGNTPFTGSFFGNNHVIRNLRIDDTTHQGVGLFGSFKGRTIRDVSLVNVNIKASASSADAGGLVGDATFFDPGPVISNVSVTGTVECGSNNGTCGGVAGLLFNCALANSWSSATVTGFQVAGGLVGDNFGTISDSFAVGPVTCTTTGVCRAGGLTGFSERNHVIERSFATGAVTGADFSAAGGLVGEADGNVNQSFASGAVSGGAQSVVGGLIGQSPGATIDQSFSIGPVHGGSLSAVGGLIGSVLGGATVTNSYWDTSTSGVASSSAGAGLTTLQLRAGLPPGFDPTLWDSNVTLSYPFVNNGGADFTSPLATLVIANTVFTSLPINQFDTSQYKVKPLHGTHASLAAVYTMMARAVGTAEGVASLADVKIDRNFWQDATQTALFAGPITQFASLGALTPIDAKTSLNRVVTILRAQRLVALRGTYTNSKGAGATHWMLATLFTTDSNGKTTAIVANDPWTGRQVEIDPVSRKVIAPSNFPLANFRIDGFQPVVIRNPA
jgi:hypothetical protein